MALSHQLSGHGLLGVDALRYGSPDRVMLVSGGPASHLARTSMIAGPPKKRAVIRQPSRTVLPAATPHSPLSGDLRLNEPPSLLLAEVEEWKHGSWYHSVTLRATDLADVFNQLQTETSVEPFSIQHHASFPQSSFWTGALAYDLVQWTQPLRLQHPPAEGALLAVLWQIENGIVIDAASETWAVFGSDEAWCEKANTALEGEPPELKTPSPPLTLETVTHTDETHQDNINRVRQGIVEGQVYQVNIGKHWEGGIDHPLSVFHRLLHSNPAPFSAYVEAEDLGFALASSSPESLLTCDGEIVRTSPIKGTCPQGATEEETLHLRSAMIVDEKERAEHRMLVDLMRNDLTVMAQPGTIGVERFDVEAYANVQHLVSHISARLKPEQTGASALQSVFPGGSITGCPRTMVCAVIDELEQMSRSFWTGSIGFIDVHSGQCSWNILIRTLEATRLGTAWRARVGAGGGITIASQAEKEVEEAAWKGAALRVAAGWMRPEHLDLPTGKLSIEHIEPPNEPRKPVETGAIHDLETALENRHVGDVLFVDNLDSFSLNIADAVALTGRNVTVLEGRIPRNERFIDPSVLHELLELLQPSHIILGPGPGSPRDCALTMAIAHHALAGQLNCPILGVCLGHQALAEADGRTVIASPLGPVHGVPTPIEHEGTGLFSGMEHPMVLTRYNSLVAVDDGDHALEVNATEQGSGLIMGLRHPTLPIHSLQVHPESVGSPQGVLLIHAFLEIQSDG